MYFWLGCDLSTFDEELKQKLFPGKSAERDALQLSFSSEESTILMLKPCCQSDLVNQAFIIWLTLSSGSITQTWDKGELEVFQTDI